MNALRATTKEIQQLLGVEADGVWGPMTAAAALRRLAPKSSVSLDEAGDELDKRTLANLRTLEPKAQEVFLPFIRRAQAIAATMGADYIAISGTRNEAQQNALYAKGRSVPGHVVTNAKYGFSNHNFGIALDFGVFSGGKYLDNASPRRAAEIHKAIGSLARKYGIEWGGDWTGFQDPPHYEVESPLTMAQKRVRLRNGTTILS